MMWKKQVFGLNILIWTFEIIVTIFLWWNEDYIF